MKQKRRQSEWSGTFKASAAAAASGAQTAPMDKVFSEQRSEIHSPTTTSAEGQKPNHNAMAQKDKDLAAAEMCAGAPWGKDLGTRYVVASCETMSIISERTGVGIKDLIDRNPQVENPDLIYPNQELWLPPRG